MVNFCFVFIIPPSYMENILMKEENKSPQEI